MLTALRKMENRGATEKAAKTRQWCGEVLLCRIVTGRARSIILVGTNSAMTGHKGESFPFLTVEGATRFSGGA
jgi:hypothetical protein